ncbi:YnjH family protein [Vibrio sp. S4M6]|uniref:DUF1496 domain-containing protein n=1 Tax=Vibrio sinus TaxID=2946865 RepID=UPI00202AA805|nr:DUF1496 domain-containing protein [Vibrio sinus]MCL9782704.1 YnjH family protein [Vibrio sinus]
MQRIIIGIGFVLISGMSFAEVISLPQHSARNAVVVNAQNMKSRVCYYQDQAYSLGAILQVGKFYMVCNPANKFETNGALKWEAYEPSSGTDDTK